MKRNVLFSALALGAGLTASAQTANVQIIHNCPTPAADSVDIYVNPGTGWLPAAAVSNLKFREATGFIQLPAGIPGVRVAVAPNDATPAISDTLASFAVPNLMSGSDYVAMAGGELGSQTVPFNIFFGAAAQVGTTGPNDFDVNIFHGGTDAPGVAAFTNDDALTPVVPSLTFGNFTGMASLPANDQFLLLTLDANFNDMVSGFSVPLATLNAGGGAGVVFASGKLNPGPNEAAFGMFVALPDGTVLELTQTDVSRIQIIHNAPDPAAASVDIYVVDPSGNVEQVEDDFDYLEANEYAIIPSGNYRILVAPSTSTDTSTAVFAANASLVGNTTYQVFARGLVDLSGTNFANSVSVNGNNVAFNLGIWSDAHPFSDLPNLVDVAVAHQSPDAPEVDVVGSTGVLVDDISFDEFQGYLTLPTIADSQVEITPSNDNNTILKTYGVPLTQLSNLGLTIFASGFFTPDDENVTGLQAFGLWVVFPDGTVVPLTEVMSIEENQVVTGMELFPNPVVDQTTLRLNSEVAENASVRVIDITGKVVMELGEQSIEQGANTISLDMSELSSGTYYLTVQGNQIKAAKAFIK